MTTVLVTRPQPDAEALAALLREKKLHALVDPLFKIEFASLPPEKGNYQALLATSRNAIRALINCGAIKDFKKLPLFTVGEETEAAARQAGFANIKSAEASAASLSELIMETCIPSKGALLYLAGKTRKATLETQLISQGFKIKLWEAYAMHPSPGLRDATLHALRQKTLDAVLLFSERASAHFLQLGSALDADGLKAPTYFCLSEQVAMPLQKKGLMALYPPAPSLHALIELLIQKNH
jgi:uroporphyrinogen-III synthase